MSNLRPALSKKLSRRILILALPLFMLSLGTFYKHATRLLHKEAIERSVTTLNTTVQLVDNYLTMIETAATSNVWMLEEFFTPDSIQNISNRIVRLNKSVLSCSVSTEPNFFPEYGKYFSVYSFIDGDTVTSVRESEFEYFEKNWYKKPLQTRKPCWINPFSDFNQGTINHHDAVGSYCIPLRPHGSQIKGVISVDFSFKKLRETVLATHHPYPSSYYMLLGPSGGYLIHPESSLLFKKTIFSATDSIEHPDIIKLGREMTARHHGTMHVKFDNELCHVCYAPVADTGWSLALVCHDDDVLRDYNHLIIVVVVITIIGIILILWIIRRVVRKNIGHINELMEITKLLAEGNYDIDIPISKHKDVVGKLQNAFRKMQLAINTHVDNIKQNDAEIKKESAELEQLLPQAKDAYRRRQVFVHNVSHQISMPLNTIAGLTRVLLSNITAHNNSGRILQSEEMKHITDTMKHDAAHLKRMTLMLFDISDTGAANTERYHRNDMVSCNLLAKECIDVTKRLYGVKDIRFETELFDSVCIKTSCIFLERTIMELLHNAIKYSDCQHIALYIKQDETTVRFIVEDVGPGIPKEIEELIFIPFMKTNTQTEGLGLGLPLCKNHIVNMEGKFYLDSDYTKGCRFIVELPKE